MIIKTLLYCILVLEWWFAYIMCLYISELPENWMTILWTILWWGWIFILYLNDFLSFIKVKWTS